MSYQDILAQRWYRRAVVERSSNPIIRSLPVERVTVSSGAPLAQQASGVGSR